MRNVLASTVPGAGERVRLGDAQAHHLIHVVRLRDGETVRVTDGAGNAAIARVVSARDAVLEVVEALPATPAPTRVVLLGCPRPALLEEAVQLGTEAGASRFVLVRARYSPPAAPRFDRLDRVVRAAVTQCGRANLPALDGPCALADALRLPDVAATPGRWLAAPGGPATALPGASPAVLAVGPEGGWSPDEVDELVAEGFRPLGLGPYVLRTPTAVAAALARCWTELSRS